MTSWVSPTTGASLRPEGANVLRDADGRRWPVIDGIPYLRVGRDALIATALDHLDAGDRDMACASLLADQDEWWTGATPPVARLLQLVRDRDTLSLREAMDHLAFDRVGTYFAHRWSDPTFLAGLALLEAHWQPTASAFELCCGIGHYGRELIRRGVAYAGGDVVFAKLWLARHWVVGPGAALACFDAAAPWPVTAPAFTLVFCHDAFYFLPRKAEVLGRLRGLRAPAGRLAIGHIHNRGADNLSAGRAVSSAEMAALFPEATIYDDAELARALAEARPPCRGTLGSLDAVEAFAVADEATLPRSVASGLCMPPDAAALRLNPLYRETPDGFAVTWPSLRYQAEYAALAPYPPTLRRDGDAPLPPHGAPPDWLARQRVLLDLPERW